MIIISIIIIRFCLWYADQPKLHFLIIVLSSLFTFTLGNIVVAYPHPSHEYFYWFIIYQGSDKEKLIQVTIQFHCMERRK